MVLCFLILEAFAFVNAYVVDLKAASIDSNRFQDNAAIWARSGKLEFVTDSEFFFQFLGIIFRFFGESEFVATQFGILAVMISLWFIAKIMHELDAKYAPFVIALVALWPSSLTRVTTTMREPYLILFLVLIVYFLIRYWKTANSNFYVKAMAWAIFSALFHKGYAVLLVGLLAFGFLYNPSRKTSSGAGGKLTLKLMVVVGFILIVIQFQDAMLNVKGLRPVVSLVTNDTEYMNRIVEYKSNRDFRTTYDAPMEFDSAGAFVTTAPKAYVYYMFAPFPWMVSTGIDVFAFVEGMIRMIAIFLVFLLIRKKNKSLLLPCFVVVTMLTFVWAAGTANYGTASRHHITTNWFFFLIYAYYFSAHLSKNRR